MSVQRRFQTAVHHHQLGLARCIHLPHVQPRVVFQHGADAGQHGTGAGAPGVAVGAGRGGRDPLTGAVFQCRLAVQRGSHLHAHPRRAPHHAAEKTDVEFARFGGTRADLDLNAGSTQPFETLAADAWIGVGERGHHFFDAGRDQRITARAGAALVGAGLQSHIGGGACHTVAAGLRIAQGHDLGVRTAGALGGTGTQQLAVGRNDDAANTWVGRCEEQDGLRKSQGLLYWRGVHARLGAGRVPGRDGCQGYTVCVTVVGQRQFRGSVDWQHDGHS